jgi:hypothetical protein
MKFDPAFLNEVRERLLPSAVIGRHYTLIKKGTEYVAKEDPSFSVNDQKRIWHDFGKANKGGDIFAFVMHHEGVDFVEAVRRCAEQCGLQVAGGQPSSSSHVDRGRSGDGVQRPRDAVARDQGDDRQKSSGGPRQIVATYDYTDAHGTLLYQVVRFEPKNFAQRRPYLESGEKCWIWALDDGEFMRRKNGDDWYRYDERRYDEKGYKQKRRLGGGAQHSLYRLPDLLDAIDRGEVIFLPEGEKDCETLHRWDLNASTNSGGAKHWNEAHAVHFTGADVVIPIDNDDAGRERGHAIAASLKGKAKRIRVLDLAPFWSGMPAKADITDWKAAGGTKEALLEIIEKVGDWSPTPPRSAFGALRFIDIDLPAREHEWLIKNLLSRGDTSILAGDWGSGKSFAATDMGFAIARAALDPNYRYMGRSVKGGLVLYQAGEGGHGLRKRMRAYRSYHGIPNDANLPFVLLPQELNLFSGDEQVKKLIEEARQWSAFYEMPIELVTIDTVSKASPGANENSAEDMTKVLNRAAMISREIGCHVMLVHHYNKAGSVRGWGGITGNVDNVIVVEVMEKFETEGEITRPIRSARVIKQKDGESGHAWQFTLPQVVLGRDVEGDPITSCVVRPLGEVDAPAAPQAVRGKQVGVMMNDLRLGIFRSLIDAVDAVGVPPPAALQLPTNVKVIQLNQHFLFYSRRVVPDPEDLKKNEKTVRTRLRDFRQFGQNCGIIGVHKTGDKEDAQAYIWPTGKPVWGRGFAWPARKAVDDTEKPQEDFWDD